ncbi:MAG: EF-hand domain-containing protein [Planctomycetota bacterium]
MCKLALSAAALAFGTSVCAGQVLAVDPQETFAWGENIGWVRLAPVDDAGDAVSLQPTFLRGFLWGENFGWINLGDGPADGVSYANDDASDYGVNRDIATQQLSGFAWGENVGWINFSGGMLADPPQPARIDIATLRFDGYVWGENIGWINLDDGQEGPTLVSLCPPDQDGNGLLDIDDFSSFVANFFAGLAIADVSNDGTLSISDFSVFVALFFDPPADCTRD